MREETPVFKVVIRDSAKQNLVEHVAFLANVSTNAARKLRSTLVEAMKSLSENPHRCPRYDAPGCSAVYRKLLVYPFLVLFIIESDTVYIEYVADGRALNRFLSEPSGMGG